LPIIALTGAYSQIFNLISQLVMAQKRARLSTQHENVLP
jgi:hypothetical protein